MGYSPADRTKLLELAKAAGKTVVDVRVGSSHIEFDMPSETPPSMESFETIELVDLSISRNIGLEEALDRAVELFDAERFWETHEVLEPFWRTSQNIDRKLLHGLILVAAALVHLQKGDDAGFNTIMLRGLKEFDVNTKMWKGFDLKKVLKECRTSIRIKKPFKLSRCKV